MTYTTLTLPRGTDIFVGLVVTTDGTDADPTQVAATTDRHPPPDGDPAWTTPTAGTVAGTARQGLTTAALTAGTRHYLWGLPADPDEHQPVLCAVVYME